MRMLHAVGVTWLVCGMSAAAQDAVSQQAVDRHSVTPLDLLRLRDVDGISISPNGSWVIYQVHQAVLETNDYRASWYVVSTAPTSTPVRVGDGGDARWDFVGQWLVDQPQWSPDSRWVAYTVLHGGALQLWRSSPDGRVREQLTHNAGDVRHFAWAPDGRRILFTVVQSRRALHHAAREAAESGVVVDGTLELWKGEPRFDVPWWQDDRAPGFGGKTIPTTVWVLDLTEAGALTRERPATDQEVAQLHALDTPELPASLHDNPLVADARRSPDGHTIAYIGSAPNPRNLLWRAFAIFTVPADSSASAPTQRTPGRGYIRALWWSADGKEIYFTGEDDNTTQQKIFAVPSAGGGVREISHSDGELLSCSLDGARVRAACKRESALSPADVIVVELTSGTTRPVTNLNPEIRSRRMSPPVRMQWVNRYRDTTWGLFLKPLDYVPGHRYPLVVTTYRAGGFLRGAAGDEYPIQPFTARGFAVLAFDIGNGIHYCIFCDSAEIARRNPDSLRLEFQSPMESLALAVHQLIDSGWVDSSRMGLSGLSHGAEITSYTIGHSALFHAAITSGGESGDPLRYFLGNDGSRGYLASLGLLGPPDGPYADRWHTMSLALNANRVTTPLLVQPAGSEFLGDLQFLQALKDHRKPVEMIIYPDEAHVKHQPRHRYVIYQRNLDWFDFWLRGVEDPDPAKRSQYERWRVLRNLQAAATGVPSQPRVGG